MDEGEGARPLGEHGQREVDWAPITVMRLDRHGRITHANAAWCAFARASGADAATIEGIGLDFRIVAASVYAAAAPAMLDELASLFAGARESLTWIYACHSTTEMRWFRLDARRVAPDDAIVMLHTNITAQYLAEARLRVQSVVAQSLAERAPLLETCGRIIRATGEGLDWDFAATWVRGDAERLHCADRWTRPGHDAPSFERATRTIELALGQGLPGRVWVRQAPEWVRDIGSKDWPRSASAAEDGLCSGFALPLGAEGEVFAVVEFFGRSRREPDIELLELLVTAGAQVGALMLRERAEERARAAEESQRRLSVTLDAVMESAPAFILAIDVDGAIRFINRVLPHHRKEDVIGSSWLMYLAPSEHVEQVARLGRVVAGATESYETHMETPDGPGIWLATNMSPMRDGDRIVGAVMVARDVTELKRTQSDFAVAQRLAAVGTLAAGIAHEINTPIQFVNDSMHFLRDASRDVTGYVATLQEIRRLVGATSPGGALGEAIAISAAKEAEIDLPYLRDNVPDAFERCVEGLGRIGTIVRSIKEFAHPAQHEMGPADLNRAVQNTLTIARNEYKYVANLETDLAELPPVTCHVNDINQVVLNLVVNAAHAIADVVEGGDDKGTITVRTRHDGDHVIIYVGDTGRGIPEPIRDRIFEPFFTTKPVGKGTGQGLALAWTIVKEKHGGELTFKSTVGEGTTFFVRLPIAGKTAARAATAAS